MDTLGVLVGQGRSHVRGGHAARDRHAWRTGVRIRAGWLETKRHESGVDED